LDLRRRADETGISPQWLWKRRRLHAFDGLTISMPDTAEDQRACPQNVAQRAGLGFAHEKRKCASPGFFPGQACTTPSTKRKFQSLASITGTHFAASALSCGEWFI
jgi:hypothetical protein